MFVRQQETCLDLGGLVDGKRRVGYGLRGNSGPDATFPNSQNPNDDLKIATIELSQVEKQDDKLGFPRFQGQ